MKNTQLVWLRNDLRLDDNPALHLAQQQGPIEIVFIACPGQWQQHDESPAKQGLKADSLKDIQQRLAEKGIRLHLLETTLFRDVPTVLLSLCQQYKLTSLWFNQETPLDERRRDEAVCATLQTAGIHCHALAPDLLVSTPVLTQQRQPFRVFTPYYRRWLQILDQTQRAPYPEPEKQAPAFKPDWQTPGWAGHYRDDLWSATESRILNNLDIFCARQLKSYQDRHDYPAASATSSLSPYLAIGRLGPRRLLATLQYHCAAQQGHWQDNSWLRELAWRDFYRQLLLHYPRLSMDQAFKPETRYVVWSDNETGFQAWCEGQTGFPIIDAAMRQLRHTGWMHNRLRMISASFLSKLLLIDWRRGERFFMQHLIDGEFAANNGGWQWSASTGCDAAPYFRIFNPTRQSERFDPNGQFIRQFVPELKGLDHKQIHNPSAVLRSERGYPDPIIDYPVRRQHAIEAFRHLPRLSSR